MISSCPNLEVLNLKGTQFHGRSFYYDLEHLRNLRSLTLGTNKYLRVQDLFVIVQISHKLEELKISRLIKRREETPLTDQDAVFLFDSLKNSICSLEFDLRNLGSPTIQAIFDCSKITKLGLYNAFSLSSELFRTIGNHLPNLSRLKICSASQLTSEDFSFVFTNYKENMRALVHLDVSGCWRLADSGLKSIADACSESLQKLSIKSCKLITNDGLEYAINRCPNLKQLNIAHAIKISDSCVTKFPSMLPRLKLLVVDRSNQKLNSLTSLVSPNRHITVKESLSEYKKLHRILL
ncbi:hypothetical protein C0J52_15616 [Blattella germanica]|nr:hypothetical protein C0J52_15616 [Blattella germanica]